MLLTRFSGIVIAGVLVGGFGAAAPASADPGNNGRGGEHTNRDNAHDCQQGGHLVRVEAETGRPFRNAGDCTSHAALGGTFDSAAQLTLSATSPYSCGALGGRCWGTLVVSGLAAGDQIVVLALPNGPEVSPATTVQDGVTSYDANVTCGENSSSGQYQAVVIGSPVVSPPIAGPPC